MQSSNLNVDHLEGSKRLSLIHLRRISKVIFHASEYLGKSYKHTSLSKVCWYLVGTSVIKISTTILRQKSDFFAK